MYKKFTSLLSILLFTSLATADDDIIKLQSSYDVQTTTKHFKNSLQKKGVTLFAQIDHAKNAKKVGQKLRPTQLLIFGNPKIGTPLIQCSQSVALDLPQKVLIYEDINGTVWLTYNNPHYIALRHNIKGCTKVINKIDKVLANFALKAIGTQE